jgi:hypothetical protein
LELTLSTLHIIRYTMASIKKSFPSLALLGVAYLASSLVTALPQGEESPPQDGSDQQQLQGVLSTLQQDPDLSMFSQLIQGTGGSSGKPFPDFEERFNDPVGSNIKWTILAPTNEVRIPTIPEAKTCTRKG